MNHEELCDWLISEALKDEILQIVQKTVAAELTNLSTPSTEESASVELDWYKMLLAGSILARSEKRLHQEAALRIATAAVSLDTPAQVKDAGTILFEQLSNHRAVELAERRQPSTADAVSRLGISMRLEACRRRFEDSILIESSGDWVNVNSFQKRFWNQAADDGAWLSASAPTASEPRRVCRRPFSLREWTYDRQEAEISLLAGGA